MTVICRENTDTAVGSIFTTHLYFLFSYYDPRTSDPTSLRSSRIRNLSNGRHYALRHDKEACLCYIRPHAQMHPLYCNFGSQQSCTLIYLSICSNTKLQVSRFCSYDYVTVGSIFQRSALLKALRCFPLKYYFWLSQQRLFESLPFYFGHQNQRLSPNNPDFSQLPTTHKAVNKLELRPYSPATCFFFFHWIQWISKRNVEGQKSVCSTCYSV